MREIVMVISDAYLPEDPGPERQGGVSDARPAPQPGSLPGIEQLTRFAHRTQEENWRGWVARWLGLEGQADQRVASVAAASATPAFAERAACACWLATPLHLIGGMARVHVDWRCVLRLSAEERERLVQGFTDTFRGSGFGLAGLESGEFLLTAPPLAPVRTTEPARLPQSLGPECLPGGKDSGVLRRLGAEIEMWLHAHPLNSERVRRGEVPVSTLWIWGGGEPAAVASPRHGAGKPAVFGSDAYLDGLCRLGGLTQQPLSTHGPAQWPPVQGSALCVLSIAETAHAGGHAGFLEALTELDRAVIAPSIEALRRGVLDRLTLLGNDQRWSLRSVDRWRFWRRARAGVEALT